MSNTEFINPEDELKNIDFFISLKKTAIGICRTKKISHTYFLLLIEVFQSTHIYLPWFDSDTTLQRRLWKKIIIFIEENLGQNFEDDFTILDYQENSFYTSLPNDYVLEDVILFLFLNLSKQNELLLSMLQSLMFKIDVQDKKAIEIFYSISFLCKEDKIQVIDFIKSLKKKRFYELYPELKDKA